MARKTKPAPAKEPLAPEQLADCCTALTVLSHAKQNLVRALADWLECRHLPLAETAKARTTDRAEMLVDACAEADFAAEAALGDDVLGWLLPAIDALREAAKAWLAGDHELGSDLLLPAVRMADDELRKLATWLPRLAAPAADLVDRQWFIDHGFSDAKMRRPPLKAVLDEQARTPRGGKTVWPRAWAEALPDRLDRENKSWRRE